MINTKENPLKEKLEKIIYECLQWNFCFNCNIKFKIFITIEYNYCRMKKVWKKKKKLLSILDFSFCKFELRQISQKKKNQYFLHNSRKQIKIQL